MANTELVEKEALRTQTLEVCGHCWICHEQSLQYISFPWISISYRGVHPGEEFSPRIYKYVELPPFPIHLRHARADSSFLRILERGRNLLHLRRQVSPQVD